MSYSLDLLFSVFKLPNIPQEPKQDLNVLSGKICEKINEEEGKKLNKEPVEAPLQMVNANWNDIPEDKRMEFIVSTFEEVDRRNQGKGNGRPEILQNINLLVPFFKPGSDNCKHGAKLGEWELPSPK